MSAGVTSRKQCIKCDKGGGVFTCDGCQRSFCVQHVSEHRQELRVELDNVMQEHDLVQLEVMQSLRGHSSFKEIDQWEKDLIAEIQATADNRRANLRIELDQSNSRLLKICRDAAADIRSCREADDFSENDLIRWKKQLKEVQLETQQPLVVEFMQDEKSITDSNKIASGESKNNDTLKNMDIFFSTMIALQLKNKKFISGPGPAMLDAGDSYVEYIGPTGNCVYIFGNLPYSSGQHTIRLKIEKFRWPYRIFLGCTSFKQTLKEISIASPNVVGWFELNQVYENGRCDTNCKKYNYNSFLIEKNDTLHLTFDCDEKQIQLFNKRLNTRSKLSVDITKLPYPWRLLLILVKKNDCVRILRNS